MFIKKLLDNYTDTGISKNDWTKLLKSREQEDNKRQAFWKELLKMFMRR